MNARGSKRKDYECFENTKPGDLVVGFETSPVNKAVGVFEITQRLHLDEDDGEEEISMLLQTVLPETYTHDKLKKIILSGDYSQLSTGSIHALEKEDYDRIINLEVSVDKKAYDLQQAVKEIFMGEQELVDILKNLIYKKNIILQGPPGTGKTFVAKRLAYLLMEEKDNSKIEMIQFHQSYAYEDFIQGYKPIGNGTFKLLNGVFYRFCKKAQADPGNKYFFIIDEINRGNLSKIFGELMLLIEADKRGPDNAVALTYDTANGRKFFIPSNLFVIGTMNTADRSLAVVDYALRRRFAFVNVNPSFERSFNNELLNNGIDEGIIQKIIERMRYLNRQILDDPSLGQGFQIGHSYFCNFRNGKGDEDWYQRIIKYEISPLLVEYWFDNPLIVREYIKQLEK
jgi:5-methylcytosine-specific restriction protein B